MQCFDAAAEAFGWSQRNPQPRLDARRRLAGRLGLRHRRLSDPARRRRPRACTLTPRRHGAGSQTAAHEIGTGAYTVIAQTAADRLGVPLDKVTVELGDSDLPPAPVAGGSNTTASVCSS